MKTYQHKKQQPWQSHLDQQTMNNMTTKLIRELQHEKYTLVQDTQEIDAILDSIGYKGGNSIGCLLVEVLHGDYGEVWAIDRFIPYLNETAYRIN